MTDTRQSSVSGGISGAAVGFKYAGPFGMVAGAAIGGLLGSRAAKKRREQELKIRIENTRQSYNIGKNEFSNLRENRQSVAKTYTRNQSQARAKFAASGANLTGASYLANQGGVARERDQALAELQITEDKFYESDAYKFIQQDYEDFGRVDVTSYSQTDGDAETINTYGLRTQSVTGEDFFTQEQAANLRTFSDDTPGGLGAANAYRQFIVPSEREFVSSRLGSDEDRTRFEAGITQRINRANRGIGTDLDELRLEGERQRAQRQGG